MPVDLFLTVRPYYGERTSYITHIWGCIMLVYSESILSFLYHRQDFHKVQQLVRFGCLIRHMNCSPFASISYFIDWSVLFIFYLVLCFCLCSFCTLWPIFPESLDCPIFILLTPSSFSKRLFDIFVYILYFDYALLWIEL